MAADARTALATRQVRVAMSLGVLHLHPRFRCLFSSEDGPSHTRRLANCSDNPILNVLRQVRGHGQADDLGGEPFRYGKTVAGARIAAVSRLAMQRLRVVDSGRDAL